jgi:hypothetical protein
MKKLKMLIDDFINLDPSSVSREYTLEIERAFYAYMSVFLELSIEKCDISSVGFQEALIKRNLLTKKDCVNLEKYFKGSLDIKLAKNIFIKIDEILVMQEGSKSNAPEVNKVIKSPFDDDFVKIDLEFDDSTQELNAYGMGSVDGSSRGGDTSTDYRGAPYAGDP